MVTTPKDVPDELGTPPAAAGGQADINHNVPRSEHMMHASSSLLPAGRQQESAWSLTGEGRNHAPGGDEQGSGDEYPSLPGEARDVAMMDGSHGLGEWYAICAEHN